MLTAANSTRQEWTIDTSWDDGTYRFQNVENGTGWNLDVHPGTPVFMSDSISESPNQPAQHWLLDARKEINDGAFSTAVGSVR